MWITAYKPQQLFFTSSSKKYRWSIHSDDNLRDKTHKNITSREMESFLSSCASEKTDNEDNYNNGQHEDQCH